MWSKLAVMGGHMSPFFRLPFYNEKVGYLRAPWPLVGMA